MQSAKDLHLEEMESDAEGYAEHRHNQEQERPQELQIIPGAILTLSKTNAEQFHQQMRTMILQTGFGAFEYLEAINFFIKLKDYISGNKQSKIPEDKELRILIREEILKHPKGKFTTPRGVTFEAAETGTSYDFEKCNDPILAALEAQNEEISTKLKARKEFLKNLPIEGITIVDEESGETTHIAPPSKTSTSSYKVSLPK